MRPHWQIDGVFVHRKQQRTLDPHHLQRSEELRYKLTKMRQIVTLLTAQFSQVARALTCLGMGQLRNLVPKPGYATQTLEAMRPDPHRRQRNGPHR